MGQDAYIEQRIPVPEIFGEVFSHLYTAKNHTATSITKTLLPSFQIILVFTFGPGVSLASSLDNIVNLKNCNLLGPVKQPVQYTLLPGSEILTVNFKVDTFYRFFSQPSPLEGLLHPDALTNECCFNSLWYQLQAVESYQDKAKGFLAFCKPYLHKREADASRLVQFLETENELDPIKAIADETNKSIRTIQLQHKKYFGFSAKEITRYNRFLKAIEILQSIPADKKVDWFEIIKQCNYYDQSHLIHDFQFFLHLSPAQYLQRQRHICIANL